MTYPPLHDQDNIFYAPVINPWRESPHTALRIFALEIVEGEHPFIAALLATAIALGFLCAVR